jgi:hypothetical protein
MSGVDANAVNLMAELAEAVGDDDEARRLRQAIKKRESNKLDLDDPKVLAEMFGPELVAGYAKAKVAASSATTAPSATPFTPSELHGSGVAACSGSQREEEEPPSTATLLDEVEQLLRRFVVFTSEGQAIAAALFVLNTYVFDLWDYTPYLAISSATSESGKSRLLDVLETVVHQPWLAIKPSEAVIYRKIQNEHPTLLLDENDQLSVESRQAIAAVLNSGFQAGRTVSRAMGEKGERIEDYDVYCPKVFAGIGKYLSDTTASRTIPVRLRRKEKGDSVEKFRSSRLASVTGALRDNLEAWALLAREALVVPECPEGLTDRQEDVWEPLLAIADMAGGDWPKRAREAAVSLYDDARKQETVSKGVLALWHIYEAFESEGVDKLASWKLLNLLASREDGSPWAKDWDRDLRFGETLRPANALANLLKEFEIHPDNMRAEGPDGQTKTLKGYRREQFTDAWRRYGVSSSIPPEAATSATPLHPTVSAGQRLAESSGMRSGSGLNGHSMPTAEPTWTFRCDGCGVLRQDVSTTRLPGISCYDGCGGTYRLAEEVA